MTPEIIGQVPTFDVSDETMRYFFDKIIRRLDTVVWFMSALSVAIIIRVVASPVALLMDRLTYMGVSILTAWRKKP